MLKVNVLELREGDVVSYVEGGWNWNTKTGIAKAPSERRTVSHVQPRRSGGLVDVVFTNGYSFGVFTSRSAAIEPRHERVERVERTGPFGGIGAAPWADRVVRVTIEPVTPGWEAVVAGFASAEEAHVWVDGRLRPPHTRVEVRRSP